MTQFRRRDLILFASLLLVGLIGLGVLFLLHGDGQGDWDAVVEYRGCLTGHLF